MNELAQLIELLKHAVEQGQTFTLTADDVTIKAYAPGQLPGGPQVEVTINAPSISTES